MNEQQAKETIIKMVNKLRAEYLSGGSIELVEEFNNFEHACEIMDNSWLTQQEAGELDENGDEIQEISDDEWEARFEKFRADKGDDA